MRFSFFKQLDIMDCGPTCLRMVAQHYGKTFSTPKLRELSHITRECVFMIRLYKIHKCF
ncbi:cysteine peptidase family C39 domain-containing protein [Roseivirga echinicomitans]